jgi:hypothetical protein
MSNYFSKAKRPGGKEFEDVQMIYNGNFYSVIFPDGKRYLENECEFDHKDAELPSEIIKRV